MLQWLWKHAATCGALLRVAGDRIVRSWMGSLRWVMCCGVRERGTPADRGSRPGEGSGAVLQRVASAGLGFLSLGPQLPVLSLPPSAAPGSVCGSRGAPALPQPVSPAGRRLLRSSLHAPEPKSPKAFLSAALIPQIRHFSLSSTPLLPFFSQAFVKSNWL